MRVAKLFSLLVLLSLSATKAQSPAPVIVQAASPSTAPSKPVAATVPVSSSVPDAIKLLEQLKATNDELLAKQKAALDQLDELQQAVDELRIFSKRG